MSEHHEGQHADVLSEARVNAWERRADVPLTLLALAFLVAYAWPILNPDLHHDLRIFLADVSWAVWVAFLIDLLARLGLARNRKHYAMTHWYDIVLVALPMLRPLRLLRLVAFLRILDRSVAGSFAGRFLAYVSGAAFMSVVLGALAVLDAERNAAGANIKTFGDALWWACTTVTTVGYGDRYPVTTEGRMVGVVLMIFGIGLVGSVTAAVASWILEHNRREVERREALRGITGRDSPTKS